ncbi:MAG TPA: hypothetical protein VN944_09895, partial [Nitrospiria bacterium]|nr:hypothetical protein [Nitrospiria bacterium]
MKKSATKTTKGILETAREKGWVADEALKTIFPAGTEEISVNIVEELLKSDLVEQEPLARHLADLYQMEFVPLQNSRI